MDERRGRACRADSDPRRRPSAGLRLPRRGRFERLVATALAGLPPALRRSVAELTIEVTELPRRLTPPIELAGYEPATTSADRIVLYRRPLEARASEPGELTTLIQEAVVEVLAAQRGWTDRDLDEFGW